MTFFASLARINATRHRPSFAPIDPRSQASRPATAVLSRVKRAASLLGVLTLALPAVATTPSAEDGFTPSANAQVAASAIQPDGKILVGGYFTSVQSPGTGGIWNRERIVRLYPDGTVDATFAPSFNGPVTAIYLQPDNTIIVGGYFTTVLDATGTTFNRNHVAKLMPDGKVDPTFDPNVSGTIPSLVWVSTIVGDGSGNILIGGEFTSIAPNGATTPTTASRIARLTSSGALDTTFSPQFSNIVRTIAVQPNGDIVVGGGFTSVTSSGNTTSTPRNRIARLSSVGVVDATFDPNPDNLVTSIALQLDGRIVVAGNFTALAPSGGDAVVHNRIARLMPDGSLDASFRAGVNSSVETVKVTPDGKIIASGAFRAAVSTGGSVATRADYMVRFFADGTIDTNFYPGPSYIVSTFSLQSDGKIFIGGSFTDFVPAAVGTLIPRRYMARLNEDGSLDASLNPSVNSQIRVMVELSDKSVLLGGSFGSIGGITRRALAKISANGTVDAAFDPGVVGTVYAIAVQPTDGKILVGGLFTGVFGKGTSDTVARNYLARFNSDGTLDTTFNPKPNGTVSAIAVQSDGKIVIGGVFNSLQPEGDTDPTSRVGIARLTSDGKVDTTFTPTTNDSVSSITIESDGHILIGGNFTVIYTGSTANSAPFLARLNTDGSFVSSFLPVPSDIVTAVKVLSDGKIVIGGRFTAVRGSGTTTFTAKRGLAMLNADGTLVSTFDPEPNDRIDSIAVQDDGKFLVAGPFTAFYPNATETPVSRNFIARLNTDGTVDSAYDPHPNLGVAIVLQQSGGGALVSGVFTSFQPAGSTAVQIDTGLARILPTGSLDTAFRPVVGGASGEVRAISYQKDGSLYVGGTFDRLAGSYQKNLVHMRAEGIVDFQFQADPNAPVNALLPRIGADDPTALKQKLGWIEPSGRLRTGLSLDPDLLIDGSVYFVARQKIGANAGKILVGGLFTASTSSFSVSNLARFNANGSLDTTFNPGVKGTVFGMTVRSSDDAILVTGSITAVGATTRNGVALLDANGGLVTGFDPNATGSVLTSAFLSDGRILIGGQFTQLQPNGGTDAFAIRRLARLSSAGAVDTSFDPEPNGQVTAITVQDSDGKILIGGLFQSLTPNNAATATTRNGIARLNTDGTVDSAFDPNMDGQATVIRIQPSDGKIVIAGTFTALKPNGATTAISKTRLARLNTDGTVDTTFDASANLSPVALEIQADGSFVIAGEFTAVNDVVRNKIARISSTGVLDAGFNPNAVGAVNALLLLDDQSIIAAGSFNSLNLNSVLMAGGEFTKVNDVDTPYLGLFTSDGNPLIGGVPTLNGAVHALTSTSDGHVLVGGDFTQADGASHNGVVRLMSNNSVDGTFSADVSGSVKAIALQADGSAVVGGLFEMAGGAAHENLARLAPNGNVDATFTASSDGEVRAIAIQRDGKILVGGSFATLAGTPRAGLGRLNPDGTIDGSFTPSLSGGAVNSIAIQSDGVILVGGTFTSPGGAANAGYAKLSAANGAVDPAYDAQANGPVMTVAITPGGKVLVGGSFTNIGGLSRYLLGRLAPISSASTSLLASSDGASLIWQRTGAGPEIPFANFEVSSNGRDWTSVGSGVRDNTIPGWKISGQTLPKNQYFYARASSLVPTSQGSSGSVIETIRAIYINSTAGGSDGSNEPPDVPPRPSTFLAETYLSANPELANALAGLPDRLDLAWVDYYIHKMSTDTEHLYFSGEGEGSVDPRLTNLSARAWVGPGQQSLIMGVSISDGPVKLFVRALGPTLANYQVPNPLADPTITVYSGNTVVASNDDWGTDPSVTPEALTEAGATPMSNALDSAVVITLQPGLYTFVIGSKGSTGVALGELFLFPGSTGRLGNLSARAQVGENGETLIAGFIRQGVGELLLRGVGPDLAQYDITDFLPDPVISLHKLSTGSVITTNDNWGQIANAISEENARAGAVPFPQGSKDSAAYVVLGSGGYTLNVTGAQAGQKGVALVEVFELR